MFRLAVLLLSLVAVQGAPAPQPSPSDDILVDVLARIKAQDAKLTTQGQSITQLRSEVARSLEAAPAPGTKVAPVPQPSPNEDVLVDILSQLKLQGEKLRMQENTITQLREEVVRSLKQNAAPAPQKVAPVPQPSPSEDVLVDVLAQLKNMGKKMKAQDMKLRAQDETIAQLKASRN